MFRISPAPLSLAALSLVLTLPSPPCAVAQTAPPAWSLEPVFVVGGAVAPPPEVFEGVTAAGLAGTRSGELLILDVQGDRVLVFGPEGDPRTILGREGAGPGELQFATGLGRSVPSGDSVWVYDARAGRYTVFPLDGGQPRTTPASVRAFGPIRPGPAGGIVQALAAPPPGGTGVSFPDRTTIAAFDAHGALRDTVYVGPSPRRVPVEIQEGNRRSSTLATEIFSPTTHWDRLSDGTVVVSDSAAYRILLLDVGGQVTGTLGSGDPPLPVTRDVRDRALEELAARLEESNARRSEAYRSSARLLSEIVERTPIADVVPRVAGVRVGPDDRIWVGVVGADGEIERIDVLERTGRRVAVLRDPPGMPDVVYGTGLVGFLGRDELDAQVVRVFRVVE